MKKTAGTTFIKGRKHVGAHSEKTLIENYLPEFRALSGIALLSGFPHECDNRIVPIMKETAMQTDLSRILVFESIGSGRITATYEWSNEGIPSQIRNLKNLATDTLPSLKTLIDKTGKIVATELKTLPVDLAAFFGERGVKSVAIYPISINGNRTGLIFYEDCKTIKKWTPAQTELFNTVTGIIGKCFECNLLNRSLKSDRERAERYVNTQSEFIARMSHEIRTPLNAILGMSEALYYKVDSEGNKRLVKSVLSSGKLLLSLLNDILEISRIDSGKLDIIIDKIDTKTLLDEIEVVYHDIAARKNLNLIIERSIKLPSIIRMDERRIKQILFNIISNAILYTRWGHVKLTADYSSVNGKIIFRISDTGPGIPADRIPEIFEEYTQYEDNMFYEDGSTGLGLALSKKLAEKMGGTIVAESTVGKGSVFTISLPSAEITESKSETARAKDFDDIDFIDSSVLIVDDRPSEIEIIENQVSDTGLKILSAMNVETALEKLRNNKVDLIIMDLYMPFISGDELVKMLRTKSDLKHIPMISYTAASIDDEKLKDLDCFDDHLYKPVSRENLFAVLTRYLKYALKKKPGKNS